MESEFPWRASYPAGVPETIDVSRYDSLVALFDESVREFPDRPAFANMGREITYRQLDDLSRNFAARCQSLGMGKGDRIALMMPNLLQYPIALFGALRAGLTVVNTNPLYTARELRHQLSDSGAIAIVILENFAHVLASVIGETDIKHVIVTGVGDCLGFPKSLIVNMVVRKQVPAYRLPDAARFNDFLKMGRGEAFTGQDLGRNDLAFLQYTGGTTGVAKGAMLSHGNMVANLLQASAWISPVLDVGHEKVVTALPLYHIFALTANCLVFMRAGGCNMLITNPRDMKGFVAELKHARFTALTGVNTLFNGLLNTDGFGSVDFSRFHLCLGGGMAVQQAVAEKWKQVTGVTLVEAYGLTETAPAVCINPMDLAEYNGSIGLPVPSTECCIKDEQGMKLPIGEAGELCVRGPQVMVGYWNRPDETEKAIDTEGWFHTGDIARMDDSGFFYIVDRKKDMILVSGFNVFPNEVEGVLASHPAVLEAGVIGISDDQSGEAVKAVVVLRDKAINESDLRAHCREQLVGYKRPRHYQFVDELPKTNVGKILRRAIRDQYGDPET